MKLLGWDTGAGQFTNHISGKPHYWTEGWHNSWRGTICQSTRARGAMLPRVFQDAAPWNHCKDCARKLDRMRKQLSAGIVCDDCGQAATHGSVVICEPCETRRVK